MPKMTDMTTVVDATIKKLASTYGEMPEALRNVDPRVLKVALKSTDGDPRFLTAEDDGSIIIWNRRVW